MRNSPRGTKPLLFNEAIERRRIAPRNQRAHGSRQHQIAAKQQQFLIGVRRRWQIHRGKPAEHNEMEQIRSSTSFSLSVVTSSR